MDPSTPRYTPAAIALHWIVAVLILCNLAFGLYLSGLPVSPAKLHYLSWHKWVGVTVFLLAAARLSWRLWHAPPGLPATMARWERIAANASHVLLYVLFFAAPITGWLYSSAAGYQTVYLGLVPIPDLLSKNRELAAVLKQVHVTIVYTMATLVAVHAAAALKHHFHDRDDILIRMLPFLRRRPA
jgi:cytochrome b561